MEFKIEFTKPALKFLDKVANIDKLKILDKIHKLYLFTIGLDIKKLSTNDDLYRLRIGNFRVIYQTYDNTLIILIVKIGHRKDIYK